MRRRLSALISATALLLVLGSPIVGEPAGPPLPQESGPRCTKCKQVGLVPCGEHRKLDLSHEHEVLYCSFVAECEACDGAGWVDCARCENSPAEQGLASKRAGMAERAQALGELDSEMGRPLRKAESAHFVLVWEIDELKVDKRRLKDHDLLHLYSRRLEELFAAYTDTFGVEEAEFAKKPRVFVWYFMEDQLEASKRFASSSAQKGVKLMGSNPNYSVAGIKRFFKGDEQLHRNLVHNVTHLLLSHQRPSNWVGHIKGGWADAGVAHWFEDRFFGVCDNYCYQEVNTTRSFKGGNWKPAVRKLVAMNDAPPAALVMQRNTTVLQPAEHAVAFSYVDFLIHKDAGQTNRLLKDLRAKVSTRDAIKQRFDWNLIQFEEAWKEWVLATYPSR